MILCAALWLGLVPAAAEPGPAIAALQARGYDAVDSFSDTVDGLDYSFVLARSSDGFGGLANAYVRMKGKDLLIYTHPDRGATPRFDEGQPRRFGAFLGKNSRTVVYRMSDDSRRRSTLYVLSLIEGRLRRVASLPEGRVLALDGKTVVATQDAPFGKLLAVGCDGFSTTVTSALRTDLVAWDGSKFVSVKKAYPAFFTERIKEGEETLAALEPDRADLAGDYAGRAITLYFDYAAAGRGREGWNKLQTRLEPPKLVPGASQCAQAIELQLRQLLKIPADWD